MFRNYIISDINENIKVAIMYDFDIIEYIMDKSKRYLYIWR